MRPIKVESEEIKRAICSGDTYIQVDNRKFLLFEVDQMKEPNGYEVTDPDEEKQLLNALRVDNPILEDEIAGRSKMRVVWRKSAIISFLDLGQMESSC